MIPATVDLLNHLSDKTFRGAIVMPGKQSIGLIIDGLIVEVPVAYLHSEAESKQTLTVARRSLERESATLTTLGNVGGPPRERRIVEFGASIGEALDVDDWLKGPTLAEEGQGDDRATAKAQRRTASAAAQTPDV